MRLQYNNNHPRSFVTLPDAMLEGGDQRFLRNHSDVTCQWPSGATSKVKVKVNLKSGGEFNTSCIRPAEHPNVEMDLIVSDRLNAQQRAEAIELAKIQLQKKQVEAIEGAAAWYILNSN